MEALWREWFNFFLLYISQKVWRDTYGGTLAGVVYFLSYFFLFIYKVPKR